MSEGNSQSLHRLISSNDEAGDVRTFVFEANGLKWVAGQSQRWILPHDGETSHDNEHWFTISSAPSESVMNISTRVTNSKYKQQLNSLKPGDEIEAYELSGSFTWEENPSQPIVMVAAGIGITPFRSILVERNNNGKKLNGTLLYFNRDDNVPFRHLLEELTSKHPDLKLRVIVGEHITADRILELAPESKEQTVYLSGAKPMVLSLSEELEKNKVKTKLDRFPGYDESNY
jgi:ferredoxin-NADP reductase